MKTKKEKHPISFYINGLVVCASLVAFAACVPGTQKATTSISVSTQINKADVTSVSVVNDQIVINGVNLDVVRKVQVQNNGSTYSFNVISANTNQLIAQSISAASVLVGAATKLILADAYGASTFSVTFDLSNNSVTTAKILDGAVTPAKISTTGAQKGQIIKYNGTAWTYADLPESQYFLGTVNMSGAGTANKTTTSGTINSTSASATPGDYYIVTTGGTFGTTLYSVGDWVISDGYDWLRIPAAKTTVTRFEGRQGDVTLAPADYAHLLTASNKLSGSSLNNFDDVDLTTSAPSNGYVLGYSTSTSPAKWKPVNLDLIYQKLAPTGNYVTSFSGDVSASINSSGVATTTVESVNGKTKTQISTSIDDVIAATDLNTLGKIVKRNAADGSINVGKVFSQGMTSSAGVTVSSGDLAISSGNLTVSGSVTAGSFSGSITGTNVSGNIPGNAANVTGTVAIANGGTGKTSYNNNEILYYNNSKSYISGVAAPTATQILQYDSIKGIHWESSSSNSVLKSDSAGGARFEALGKGDLPTGTITANAPSSINPNYAYISQFDSNSSSGYVLKDSPIAVEVGSNNIGIGTTSFNAKLEVKGKVRVTNNYIDLIDSGSTVHKLGHDSLVGSNNDDGLSLLNGSSTKPTRFYLNGSEVLKITSSGVIPTTDNTLALGSTTNKYTAVYATNGTIQTSDKRQKKNISESDLGLEFINKLKPVSYFWKDGKDSALHYGLIAQETEKVINDHHKFKNNEDLPIVDYNKEHDKYGIRYTELISPIIKAIQEFFNKWLNDSALLHREIASIKAENEALKTKVQKAEKEQAEMKARLDRLEKALNKKK